MSWSRRPLTALQFGVGAGTSLTARSNPDAEPGAPALQLVDHFLIEERGPWSLQAAAIAQWESEGDDWLSSNPRGLLAISACAGHCRRQPFRAERAGRTG